MKLDLLAKVEQLIEGAGEAVIMLLRSVVVAPAYFFRASPFDLITQGIEQRRLLPPLLFLAIAALPLVAMTQFVSEAPSALSSQLYIAKSWSKLRSLNSTDVFLAVAPAVGVAWFFARIASSLLARLTGLAQDGIQATLLYLWALALCALGLSVASIIGAIRLPGDAAALLPEWFSGWAPRAFEIALPAMLLALCWHFGRAAWRHQVLLSRLPRGGATALAGALPIALLFVAGPLAADAQEFALSLPDRWGRLSERERLAVLVDDSHCHLGQAHLDCVLVVRPLATGDLLMVEIVEPRIRGSSADGSEPVEAPLTKLGSVPSIGAGQTLILKGGEQAALGLRVPFDEVCAVLVGGRAGESNRLSLRFQLLGYRFRGRLAREGFERYRVGSGLKLPQADVQSIRAQCK